MAGYQTPYLQIASYDDDDEDDTGEDTDNHLEAGCLIHEVPEGSKGRLTSCCM